MHQQHCTRVRLEMLLLLPLLWSLSSEAAVSSGATQIDDETTAALKSTPTMRTSSWTDFLWWPAAPSWEGGSVGVSPTIDDLTAPSEIFSLSWYDYMSETWNYFMAPTERIIEDIRADIQNDLEIIEASMDRTRARIQQDVELVEQQAWEQVEYVQKEISCFRKDVNIELRRARRRLDQRIRRYVFQQRVGWDLLIHSILNHSGFALGAAVSLAGYKKVENPKLAIVRSTAAALQGSMLMWEGLAVWTSVPPGSHGIIAIAIGVAMWKFQPRIVSRRIPPLYLSIALFTTLIGILDKESSIGRDGYTTMIVPDIFTTQSQDEMANQFVASKALVVTLLSLLGLRQAKIPLHLAAASLSGATLVYNSVAAEISGNWLAMMERLYTIFSQILLPVLRPILRLVSRIGTKAAYKRIARDIFGWEIVEETKSALRQVLAKTGATIWKSWRASRVYQKKIHAFLLGLPIIRPILKVTSQLEKFAKRHRHDLFPLALAAVGVSRQMGWVTNFRDFRHVFGTVLNPGKMVVKTMKKYTKLNFKNMRVSVKRIVSLIGRGSTTATCTDGRKIGQDDRRGWLFESD